MTVLETCGIIIWSALCVVVCVIADESKLGGEGLMKVKPSVKPICEKCKIIKRKGKVMVICENPRHKQKQG